MLFFLLGVWLARNGAKARLLSRSEVQRQPKRAPMRRGSRGLIPKWSLKQSGAPSLRNINLASCRKPRPSLLGEVVSERSCAEKACTRRCWPTWRRERANGILEALTPRKRGPKSKRNPLEEENLKLQRQNARLTEDLRKAHIIIDVQKKVAALLGRPIPEPDPEENS